MHVLIPSNHIEEHNENNLSLLRSKIRGLHPIQRASLEALLRHLLHVTSHSDKNEMTVKELSARLCHYVLGAYEVLEDGINLKVCYIDRL